MNRNTKQKKLTNSLSQPTVNILLHYNILPPPPPIRPELQKYKIVKNSYIYLFFKYHNRPVWFQ